MLECTSKLRDQLRRPTTVRAAHEVRLSEGRVRREG